MEREVTREFLHTYRRVLSMSADGLSLNSIARTINDETSETAKAL